MTHVKSIIQIVVLCFICTSFALPSSATTFRHRASPNSNSDCITNADNDLYGKGVRIGLYLQWASGFILRNLESFEVRARVRTVSNTICAAIALATIVNILEGNALSVDYLLSYYLTVVLFYAESYNLEIRVEDYDATPTPEQLENEATSAVKTLELHADAALVFQNIIFAAFTLFGAWYWLKGLNLTTDPACGAHAAMLALFNIHNEMWTHAAAGLAIIAGAAFLVVFLVHLVSLQEGIASGPKLVANYYAKHMFILSGYSSNDRWKYTMMLKKILKPNLQTSGSTMKGMTTVKVIGHLIHWSLINLAGPLIAIISVERMIETNHLVTTPVFGSAGQVIALFSGITSASLACWEVLAKYSKKIRRPEEEAEQDGNPIEEKPCQCVQTRELGESPMEETTCQCIRSRRSPRHRARFLEEWRGGQMVDAGERSEVNDAPEEQRTTRGSTSR